MQYEEISEGRLKHLEMIQAVIGRLGTDAFVVKGWAITVSGAFFGFSITKEKWGLALASAIPTLIFWALDSYFLRSERLFRALFDRVRDPSCDIEPYFMAATSAVFIEALPAAQKKTLTRRATFYRPTLLLLYGGLLVAAAVVLAAVALFGDSSTTAYLHVTPTP